MEDLKLLLIKGWETSSNSWVKHAMYKETKYSAEGLGEGSKHLFKNNFKSSKTSICYRSKAQDKLKRHIQESCKKKGSKKEENWILIEELNAKGKVCLVNAITSLAIFKI